MSILTTLTIRVRRTASGLLLAVLLVVSATAGAGVFNPETFMLENGMRVVVIPNHRAPVVTHMVWYKVGSADEGEGESGIAHFLEHLMFKGTKTRKPGEFSRILARHGGQENAFTSYDYTGYFQKVAKDRLAMVMEMEADRMTNLVITEKEVAPERQVVLEERRSRTDNNPGAILREHVNGARYLNYPYRRPIIGWEHEIAALDVKRILAFYKRWYAPNNAILVVEGDVTKAELVPLAEKYYGPVPANPDIKRIRPDEPPQKASRDISLADARVRQPSWSRSWMAPSYMWGESKHADALEVLSEILGGGSTSRLYRALVVDGKLAVSAGAWYDGGNLGPSTAGVYASPRPNVTMEQVAAAAMKEVERVLAEGVTEDEVARAKKRMRAGAVYARDSFGSGARALGAALAMGRSIEHVESWPDRIGRVTTDDVRDAARAIIQGKPTITSRLLAKPQG